MIRPRLQSLVAAIDELGAQLRLTLGEQPPPFLRMGHEIIAGAPRELGELPPWLTALPFQQFRSCWVAAVASAAYDELSLTGEIGARDLLATLVAVRKRYDHSDSESPPAPPPTAEPPPPPPVPRVTVTPTAAAPVTARARRNGPRRRRAASPGMGRGALREKIQTLARELAPSDGDVLVLSEYSWGTDSVSIVQAALNASGQFTCRLSHDHLSARGKPRVIAIRKAAP